MHNLAAGSSCGCYCDKMNKKLLATVLILIDYSWAFGFAKFIRSSLILWEGFSRLIERHQFFAVLCLCDIMYNCTTFNPNLLKANYMMQAT